MQIDPDFLSQPSSLSAAYIGAILPDVCAHYGIDQKSLLQLSAIEPYLLEREDALVPLLDVVRLFMVLHQQTEDAGLGFEIGRHVKPRCYPVLGHVILSSRTLGEAIERLIQYEKLGGQLGSTQRIEKGDLLELHWCCPVKGDAARYITEAAITGWVAVARHLVGGVHAPRKVCFSHSLVGSLARYEDWFSCPVEFAAGWDGVVIDIDQEEMPVATADPVLARLMEKEAQQRMSDYDVSLNVVNALRSVLYQLLADGEPSIERVAREMGMAPRTLQSRLKKQGMGYQEVLDNLRKSLASIYLAEAALSLTDIAFLLGFSEQSSFTRVFKRWHGVSPAQWRKGNIT